MHVTLICTPLRFYTKQGESLFFAWLKKVKSVKDFQGIARELHVLIESNKIPDKDLLNLMGIFDRYRFDQKQLRVFMNEENKEWFDDIP